MPTPYQKTLLIFVVAIIMFQNTGCKISDDPSETDADVRILSSEMLYGGINHYRVALSKYAATTLLESLNQYATAESIIAVLEKISKKTKKPELVLLGLVIVGDILLFKKALKDNMGPNGVIIDVWGPRLSTQPDDKLCFTSDGLIRYCFPLTVTDLETPITMPKEYKDGISKAVKNIKVLLTFVKTVPVYWKIVPRQ